MEEDSDVTSEIGSMKMQKNWSPLLYKIMTCFHFEKSQLSGNEYQKCVSNSRK